MKLNAPARIVALSLCSGAIACSSSSSPNTDTQGVSVDESGGDSTGGNTPGETPENPGDGVNLGGTPDGDAERCSLESLVDPEVYTRRMKTLLTGLQPTSDEVAGVIADPAALKEHVTRWVETEAFRNKMLDFFPVVLQQTSRTRADYVSQLIDRDSGGFNVDNRFYDTMNQSMARTALAIIEDGRPFTEIASSRTWMMTTELMAFLASADSTNLERFTFYHEPMTLEGVDYDANTPLGTQIANRVFYSTTPIAGADGGRCTDPYTSNNYQNSFVALLQGQSVNLCARQINLEVFRPEDRSDWREVTMVDGNAPRFWDSRRLRGTAELPLTIRRTGYFSHPAFLATWRSNIDNSFRVTMNQTLIVGLGLAFEDTDVSTPIGDDGLADDHASPTTACYACHKNLDPMRNYFALEFDPDYYSALEGNEVPDITPSFSFQGYSAAGETLADLGATIAEHPYFSSGWVQKMCYFANSQECNADDPEFQRVVTAFEDSNYDFKTLVVELFSSPLLTGARCAPGYEGDVLLASVSRREHFCTAIDERMGIENLCGFNGRVDDLSDALPADGWSRGADRPDQPTEPSLFYTATTEALCSEIATRVVNRDNSPIQTSDVEGSIDALVERFMGIATTDPRYATVHEWLSGHHDDAAEFENNRTFRMRSTVTLACTSPFLLSTDF